MNCQSSRSLVIDWLLKTVELSSSWCRWIIKGPRHVFHSKGAIGPRILECNIGQGPFSARAGTWSTLPPWFSLSSPPRPHGAIVLISSASCIHPFFFRSIPVHVAHFCAQKRGRNNHHNSILLSVNVARRRGRFDGMAASNKRNERERDCWKSMTTVARRSSWRMANLAIASSWELRGCIWMVPFYERILDVYIVLLTHLVVLLLAFDKKFVGGLKIRWWDRWDVLGGNI